MAEISALEERLADIAKDARLPDELTGMEDANVVIMKLSKMRSLIGFREVAKFKRRSRFLEFFVIVSFSSASKMPFYHSGLQKYFA